MSYDVLIERLSDHTTQVYHMDTDWADEERDDWWWWTSGNYGCDCKRYLCFERAQGHQPELDDPNVVCGETRYRVIEARLPDGQIIPIDEA